MDRRTIRISTEQIIMKLSPILKQLAEKQYQVTRFPYMPRQDILVINKKTYYSLEAVDAMINTAIDLVKKEMRQNNHEK